MIFFNFGPGIHLSSLSLSNGPYFGLIFAGIGFWISFYTGSGDFRLCAAIFNCLPCHAAYKAIAAERKNPK